MPVDVVSVAVSTAISAAVQGLVGMLIWLGIRRNIEKVDRLERDVKSLETEKIDRLESDLEKHEAETNRRFEADTQSRRKIHEELTFVRTHFVHVETCKYQHEKFEGAVQDLARVQERTEATTRLLEKLNERITGMVQDIARVEALQEANHEANQKAKPEAKR